MWSFNFFFLLFSVIGVLYPVCMKTSVWYYIKEGATPKPHNINQHGSSDSTKKEKQLLYNI